MTAPGLLRLILLGAAIAAGGCTAIPPPAPRAVAGSPALAVFDRLYCGRAIPAGGVVTDDDLARFLAEVVTPRFPAGFTVLHGDGQWREPSGVIARERCFVLELNHADTAAAEQAVQEVIAEYKRRFGQYAVLRLREHVDATML